MVIRIHDVVASADTGDQGQVVFDRLRRELLSNSEITVSFAGVKTVTSSFVNAAFVQLLRTMALDEIKSRLKVVDSTRQINDMIRARLEREGLAAA